MVAGDFNGDGRLDLALAYSNDDGLRRDRMLMGNGDGTFQPARTFAAGVVPGVLVAGDFTGDGKLDLAVAGDVYNSVTNTDVGEVSVLLGNGDGTFAPPVTYAVEYNPESIVAGDFNSDGHLDLAEDGSSGVIVLLGNGDGTFQAPKTFAVANPGLFRTSWRVISTATVGSTWPPQPGTAASPATSTCFWVTVMARSRPRRRSL